MPIAEEMKNLTEEIAVSYGERVSWFANLQKDTRQMMGHFGKERQAMAKELANFLNNSESARLSSIKEILSTIRARQGEREKEVTSLLKKFEVELGEIANGLAALLAESNSQRAKSETERLEEFKKTLAAIKSQQRAREKEVAELLGAFQKDISEAQGHWQNLAKIMASKRGGKKEAKVPKRVEEAAERAFEEGELKVKVLDLIEGSPEGTSLENLGKELGVPRIRLARPINELLGEGKIIKRDKLYLPASAEA